MRRGEGAISVPSPYAYIMAKYSEAQRIQALAALELNQGRVRETAAAQGLPESTLRMWRNQVSSFETPPDPTRHEQLVTAQTAQTIAFADRLVQARDLALATLVEKLPDMSGRDVAIAVGILTDKHLDITLGRKGATIVNDNRQFTVPLPEGTTLDDLRALRDRYDEAITIEGSFEE